MTSFDFWQKWLKFVGIYLAIFGLCLSFFSQSDLMSILFHDQIDPSFFKGDAISDDTHRFQGWIYGVLGAVVAGWGILIAFWAAYPFCSKQPWAWKGLAVGVIAWYLPDTFISIKFQVYFNVVFNTFLLAVLILPLIFTRKSFVNQID